MSAVSAIPYLIYAACAGVAEWTNPISQPGSPGYTPTPEHHLRFVLENDAISGRDCNYSNGGRLDYAQAIAGSQDAWGISLTQNMYTPVTHTRHAVPGEHPYCGYLGVGAAYLLRGNNFGCATEFQVGTTGKASFAGKTQNALHGACAMEQWDGWNDQVPSEITFQLTSRQEWNLPILARKYSNGLQSDGAAYLREAVGTVQLAAGGGLYYRIGYNLAPYSQVTGNSSAVYGIGVLDKPDYSRSDTSYFLVFEAANNYVARDITIDGGVFHDFKHRTCGRTPWQPEGRVGACVVYHGIDYYLGLYIKGRTYRTQKASQAIGTFSIGWHW